MTAEWPASTRPDCAVCVSLAATDIAPIDYPPLRLKDDFKGHDRVAGTLLGAALAEAVGRLAEDGKHIALERLTPGVIATGTATQLMLFTAEGVLRMMVRADIKGIGPAYSVMRHAYDGWMFTQERVPEEVKQHWASGSNGEWPLGWLVRCHELHDQRGGFDGTISALGKITDIELVDGEFQPRVNKSEGAGAVVRAAPIGLLASKGTAFELGVWNAGFTHGGATAYLASGFLSSLVARLAGGQAASTAVHDTLMELLGWPHNSRLVEAVAPMVSSPVQPKKMTHAASALHWGMRAGLGFDAPFLQVVPKALETGGTAAAIVAGTLWGARFGAAQLPARLRTSLDVGAVIDETADAVSVGRREWVQGISLGPASDDLFDGTATAHLLWPRFPGY